MTDARRAPARDPWVGIELRHFSTLAAIDRERSFRGAAAHLGYAQSAVSRQIAVLEAAAGSRLVERSQGPRPVELTEAGRLLLMHASEILAAMEAARADLNAVVDGCAGSVRVGAFPGVPARILGRALAAFVKRRPAIQVQAAEHSTDAPLFALVETGDIDLAFSFLPPPPGPFARCELLRVPWALLVQAGTPLAVRDVAPTAAEVARLPLVTAKSPRMNGPVEARLRSEVGEPRIVFRSDMFDMLRDLVAAGVGAAIVPNLTIEPADRRLVALDLGGMLPPLGVGVVWHSDRRLSAPVVEFRDLLCLVCENSSAGRRRPRFAREAGPVAAVKRD